jgi:hypothetical protein
MAAATAPTFHVLLATIGRPTLRAMLDSLRPQLRPGDALTVVFDGADPAPCLGWLDGFGCRVAAFAEQQRLGDHGHAVRTRYSGRLEPATTFVVHADDDDVFAPGAFDVLRAAAAEPDTLYVYRFGDPRTGAIVPRDPRGSAAAFGRHRVFENNIGTPCGVIPWGLRAAAPWPGGVGGDARYFVAVAALARRVALIDEVLYVIRPHEAAAPW